MWRIYPCGPRGLLVELRNLDEVMRFTSAVEAARRLGELADIVELTPAARTLLVICQDVPGAAIRTAQTLGNLELATVDRSHGQVVQLPVTYKGPDLDLVAIELGISVDEVIRRHTSQTWAVAFTGFAPGFGYLADGHPGLEVARLPEPRTRVPPGSVGLAGEFSCVYPRTSPGGWKLIGHTQVSLFDIGQDEPALLRPGMRVQFIRTAE